MTGSTWPVASVLADLTLDADGVIVRIQGDDDVIVVDVEEPAALASSVVGLPLPASRRRPLPLRTLAIRSAGARAADALALAGLTVTVRVPRGELLRAGRGVTGTWRDRLVSGSSRLRIGRWDVVRPPLAAAVQTGTKLAWSQRRRRRAR